MSFISMLRVSALAISVLALGHVAVSAQEAKPPRVKISTAQARAIALKKYHGKVTGKTPLENEEGKWQYGVLVKSGKTLREVMVNAMTGRIDSVEVTTEAREKAEEKADLAKAKKLHKQDKEEDEKGEKEEKGKKGK